MRVFRRSQSTRFESETAYTSANLQIATRGTAGLLPSRDYGPILVAVDGSSHGWGALEWAAAEAAARQCALRIVHSVKWPASVPDISGGVTLNQWDSGIEALGARVLDEAADRARSVAPALRITTHMHLGAIAMALLREAHQDTLIVLGRERGSGRSPSLKRSVSRQVTRRAKCPVAIVELSDKASHGPSAGRVVVSIDGKGDALAALGFAFRAAQRRGVGVTAVLGWLRRGSVRQDAQIAQALLICQTAYPDVEVRQRVAAVPPGPALVAESAGAALVVLGTRAHARMRRALFESEETVLRSAHSSIAIIRTPTANRGSDDAQ
jgi:nucleotide-binding universal stress UspA family protein